MQINSNRNFSREIYYYIITICLCLLFLFIVLQLWSVDITIPFAYSGDAHGSQVNIKGMIDNGWYTINPFLGAPMGYCSYDMTNNDHLNSIIQKFLTLIFPNWVVTVNIFYLLTFPLTAITSYFTLRKMTIYPLPAILGSLLFTFIPFHFLRGQGHLVLSPYYLVPLIVLVIMWVFKGNLVFSQAKSVFKRKNVFSIIVCIARGFVNRCVNVRHRQVLPPV